MSPEPERFRRAHGSGAAGRWRPPRRYVLGIAELRLQAEARVLAVGCDTGLHFPLLYAAVRSAGRAVRVDARDPGAVT